MQAIDSALLALTLGATFVARSFSGDKAQLVPLIKAGLAHKGFAFIDVISPCVTFNDHEGSTKSYAYTREHQVEVVQADFVPMREEITAEQTPGAAKSVRMHDGSWVTFRSVAENYDATDRDAAYNFIRERRRSTKCSPGCSTSQPTARPSRTRSSRAATNLPFEAFAGQRRTRQTDGASIAVLPRSNADPPGGAPPVVTRVRCFELALVAALLGAAVGAAAAPTTVDSHGCSTETLWRRPCASAHGVRRRRLHGPRSPQSGDRTVGVFDAATAELRAADPSLTGQVRHRGRRCWWILRWGTGSCASTRRPSGATAPQPSGSGFFEMRARRGTAGGSSSAASRRSPATSRLAVDIATQTLLPFDPAAGAGVYALLVRRSPAGGSFDSVGSLPPTSARLDLAAGTGRTGPSVASSARSRPRRDRRSLRAASTPLMDRRGPRRGRVSSHWALDLRPAVFSTLGGSFVSAWRPRARRSSSVEPSTAWARG
jgi:hypothetical protein